MLTVSGNVFNSEFVSEGLGKLLSSFDLFLTGPERIESQAFGTYGKGLLKLSGTFKTIDNYAFAYSQFSKIILAHGDVNIGVGIFAKCPHLSNFMLPSGSLVKKESFKDYNAFFEIKPLFLDEDLDAWLTAHHACFDLLPKGLALKLARNENQTVLTDDDLPDQRGEGWKYVTSVIIPEGIESIDPYLFYESHAFKTVVIPNTVKRIGEGAFSACGSLYSLTLPAGLRSLGAGCFLASSSLTAIIIPEGLETIEGHTFEFCSNLQEIALPKSLKTVKEQAFKNCTALEKFSYQNQDLVAESAWTGCTALQTIVLTVAGLYSGEEEEGEEEEAIEPENLFEKLHLNKRQWKTDWQQIDNAQVITLTKK